MKRSKSHGFTLVELLVVISIIGVLASLILPAVNAARHAAQRAQCMSNMRNVSLAAINVATGQGAFPGWRQPINSPQSSRGVANYVFGSWVVPLLPALEQTQLYDHYRDGFTQIATTDDMKVGLPVLLCPSTTLAKEKEYLPVSFVANGGVPNYDGTKSAFATDGRSAYDGVFVDLVGANPGMDGKIPVTTTTPIIYDSSWAASKVAIDSITDGTSNTMLFTENLHTSPWTNVTVPSTMIVSNNQLRGSTTTGFHTLLQNGLTACWPVPVGTLETDFGTACDTVTPIANETPSLVPNWISACPNRDILPSDWPSADPSSASKLARNFRYARPSSRHTGVVNMAFADNSCRAVNDSISPFVLKKIMAANDQKSVMTAPYKVKPLDGGF